MVKSGAGPYFLITMGDPCGIGPEIILKALSHKRSLPYTPIVLGDLKVLESTSRSLGLDLRLRAQEPPFKGASGKNEVLVFQVMEVGNVTPGAPDLSVAGPVLGYIRKAVELLLKGEAQAMVTCPVNKSVIERAGFDFKGHTGLIAGLCGVKDYVMMLLGGTLRVSLVSTHHALRDVPRLITRERVLSTTLITWDALIRDFGIREPRVAVAALNPHAGEGGLFGDEEMTEIVPAVNSLHERGLNIQGPISPDTVYLKAHRGEFDAVISMYHDQGLIPLKLLHFRDGVNVTLGLPVIRTSVDHGTAYEIAGRGIADPLSLISAMDLAYQIFLNRSRSH